MKASVYINLWLDGSWHVFHTDYGEIPCESVPGVLRPQQLHRSRPVERSESTPQGVTYSHCKKGDIFMLR